VTEDRLKPIDRRHGRTPQTAVVRGMRGSPREGFSIVEALVVLAISGMALAIIFTIGVRAGDAGFALGRRAISAADLDLAVSDLRTLLRSYEVRPADTFVDGVDDPLIGTIDRLEGPAVMNRATQCAPEGWSGNLILTVEGQGRDRTLTCQAGDRRAVLFELAATEGVFSYSTDARTWSPSYENRRAERPSETGARSQAVYIRFEARPLTDVVERAESGQPSRWFRNDLEF
jgi:type II secretory pathway pseudopilin PulG